MLPRLLAAVVTASVANVVEGGLVGVQLTMPVPHDGFTFDMSTQSGSAAEIVDFDPADLFGITVDPTSMTSPPPRGRRRASPSRAGSSPPTRRRSTTPPRTVTRRPATTTPRHPGP